MSGELTRALLAALSDEDLDLLAERLAPRLERRRPPERRWLTSTEAAERLGCTPKRIYDLCQSRRLSHRRDGRRLLIDVAMLDAYLEASADG